MNLLNIINRQLDRATEADANKKAYARCKRKAKNLGVSISIERDSSGNGYWLNGTGRDDENFSTSWLEVEEKLDALLNNHE